MPNRISKLTQSVKQLGEIQVTDWDLMGLLHTDIKELKVVRSLRKLGNVKVMEWDFRTVLPAVNRVAHREVDLVDIFKRAANYRVIEWDFRQAPPAAAEPAPQVPAGPPGQPLEPAEVLLVGDRLKGFLQYVVGNLIDEPKHAVITVTQGEPGVLRLKLLLVKRDVAMLIGRQGFTASAIRRVLKTTAKLNGVRALLEINSHEEEAALSVKQDAPRR